MKDVRNKARNKSIKGIPVKYKGEVVLLDPRKVAIATFSVTASLVILGTSLVYVKAPEILQSTGQVMTEIGGNFQSKGEELISQGQNIEEERQYNDVAVFKYYGEINRNWEDKGYIPYQKEGDSLLKNPDVEAIYNDMITNDNHLMDAKLYTYFMKYRANDKKMLKYLGQIDKKEYDTISDYVTERGFEDYEEFKKHCDELVRNELKSQLTKEEKVEDIKNDPAVIQANNDLTTFWVSELEKAEDVDAKIFEFYKIYKDKDLVDELVMKYGFNQGMDYNNLEQYLMQKGYSSIEEWSNYYMEQTESHGRGM